MDLDDKDHELGDWRISAVARIAQDVPATPQGAPAHKAGTPLYVVSSVKMDNGVNIGFTLPSAPALALDIASRTAATAVELLRSFAWRDVITPNGPGFSVSDDDIPALFDFFQHCMVVSAFSYQALEVFCNYSIERHMKESMAVKRRGKKVILSPEEIERQLSTSDKLDQVLPTLYDTSTPKGKKVWEPYRQLQQSRDSSIHLKSKDQKGSEYSTLYYQFLSGNFVDFPKAAANMIEYYLSGKPPRWLVHWKKRYA